MIDMFKITSTVCFSSIKAFYKVAIGDEQIDYESELFIAEIGRRNEKKRHP